MTGFGQRLSTAISRFGRLCVGIDPHDDLLRQWDLPVSAAGAREFSLRVLDAAAGRVGVVKPQVSFFERWGAAGFAVLEEVIGQARASGLLVIGDAKRGDIGSTMRAYADAWLNPGGSLEVDALTVSPYLGVGALEPAFTVASEHGKGLFILAATSNPEGAQTQRSRCGESTLAARVADEVKARNRTDGPLADFGVVIGATVDRAAFGLDDDRLLGVPLLAPGFGHQGARLGDLQRIFGRVSSQVVANESRGIVQAGAKELSVRIDERVNELREAEVG